MVFNLDISSEIEAVPEIIDPQIEQREGELCLTFFVPSGKKFALPAFGVREVISTIADRITPIPNASPFLLGTYNWRGQVIWIADLGQFLGDTVLVNTDRTEVSILVVEEQETVMGFAIRSVANTEWLNIKNMTAAQDLPDSMLSLVKGRYILANEEDGFLHLLDQIAILSSARWAS
jgi:purine-binding chemotaxis protein CheW